MAMAEKRYLGSDTPSDHSVVAAMSNIGSTAHIIESYGVLRCCAIRLEENVFIMSCLLITAVPVVGKTRSWEMYLMICVNLLTAIWYCWRRGSSCQLPAGNHSFGKHRALHVFHEVHNVVLLQTWFLTKPCSYILSGSKGVVLAPCMPQNKN